MRADEKFGGKVADNSDILFEIGLSSCQPTLKQSIAYCISQCHVIIIFTGNIGKLALNICVTDKKKCVSSRHCPVQSVWVTAQSKVADVLRKANFDDLAKQKY